MSDQTEGPWKVSRRFDIYSDRGPLVGGTYIGTTRGNGELPKSVELTDEANARLIAAAPELLEACKAAMRIETLWGPNDEVHFEYLEEDIALSKMREAFQKAINKAEGDEWVTNESKQF